MTEQKFNGKILKKIREQKGVTQVQLCDATNLDQASYSKYERAVVKNPPAIKVKAIADYLGVPYESFFGEIEKDLRPQHMAITIKQARLNARLTQAEAAEKLKMPQTTLCHYERNMCRPSAERFETLCELYGVPTDDVIWPSGQNRQKVAEPEAEGSTDLRYIIECQKSVIEAQRQMLVMQQQLLGVK